jgi:hypothetical protein
LEDESAVMENSALAVCILRGIMLILMGETQASWDGLMKIVFLLPCEGNRPSGGFKVVNEYANGLAKRQHEVHLVHTATCFPIGVPKRPRQMLEYLRYFSFAVRGNWNLRDGSNCFRRSN